MSFLFFFYSGPILIIKYHKQCLVCSLVLTVLATLAFPPLFFPIILASLFIVIGRVKGAGSPSGSSCPQMACGNFSARALCWCCRLVGPWVMLALALAVCYVYCWGVCSGKPDETELIHMFKLGDEFWLIFADTEASKATWSNLPICRSLASRNLLRKVTVPVSLGPPPLPSPPFLPFLFSSPALIFLLSPYVPLPSGFLLPSLCPFLSLSHPPHITWTDLKLCSYGWSHNATTFPSHVLG